MSTHDPRGIGRTGARRGDADAATRLAAELDARLDAAFARHPSTDGLDDLDDLRSELRASLAARAGELQASGDGPAAAVARAFDELGDVDAIVAEVLGVDDGGEAPPADADGDRSPDASTARTNVPVAGAAGADPRPASHGAPGSSMARDHAALLRRHRVRPRPRFVVRTVVLALVAAAGLVLTVLAGLGMLGWPLAASVAVAIVLLAVPVGVLVGDGAHQETTMSFPVPGGRAACYGAAAFLGTASLALGGLVVGGLVRGGSPVWVVVVAAILLVAAIAWFGYLGATQTNRKKPWARRLMQSYQGTDRFSQDEAAAARFGIYTVVIFVAAIAVFLVLSFTIGFAWSWLALVAGFLVFFLTLARMLFPNDRGK